MLTIGLLVATPSIGAGSDRTRAVLGALGPVLIGLAAAAATLQLRPRPGWRRLAIALGCWWLGDAAMFVHEMLPHELLPALADGARMAFGPCAAWALLSFPSGAARRADRARSGFDAVTVLLSAAMGLWYLVIGPAVHEPGSGGLALVADVAASVGDLLLLFAVTVTLLRSNVAHDLGLRLLVGAMSSVVIADVTFAHLAVHGEHDGGVPGPVRAGLWVLFLLAAQAASRAAARDTAARESAARSTAAGAALARQGRSDGHPSLAGLGRSPPRRHAPPPAPPPHPAVAAAYGLLLYAAHRSAAYPLNGLILGATAVTAAALARQVSMIRENTRLMSRLRNLADVDALTGIPNRRAFFEEAEVLFQGDRRSSAPSPPCHGVLMIDVDYFKEVNDTYGHRTGDRVLSVVAACVKSQLRSADLVGRYGGDELIIALPDCDGAAALAVAERISTVVASTPVVTDDGVISVTLSIGVAGSVEDGEGLLPVLARADLALYEAKRAGRACVRKFDDAGPQTPFRPDRSVAS